METILRFLNARSFAVAGIVLASVVLADRYQGVPRRWWSARVDSGADGRSTLSADISAELDKVESRKLRALHKAVSAEIAVARAKGFDVARLQPIADKALALDVPAYRPAAVERLNRLRLVIPQEKESFRPAAVDEDPSDGPATPRSRAKRASARKAKKTR